MVFIHPFNLHMRQSLITDFHFWMYSLFVMDNVSRHVFTGNLQTQIFIFSGTFCINPVETQDSKNFSLSFIFDMLNDHYLTLELKYLRNVLRNTTTIHTGSSHRFLVMSIKYLTNNKE